MRWSPIRILLFATAVGSLTTGCLHPHLPPPIKNPHGLLVVFPGVEGRPDSVSRAVQGFRDGGVTADIRVHDWVRPGGWYQRLTDMRRNRTDSRVVAASITEWQADHPEEPVDLVGYSGGGGLAVMTAEALPPSVHLRRIVLCQPALSPSYDLTHALKRTREGIVAFYCPRDWFVLGVGTTMFGTIDRRFSASAGMYGFKIDQAVPDPASRGKLVQHEWETGMREVGHVGDHASIFGQDWNREYIAPYFMDEPVAAPTADTSSLRDLHD